MMSVTTTEPRYELGRCLEQRGVYRGRYVRYGKKKGHGSDLTTLCLEDVRDSNGKIITHHVWLNLTEGFKNLGMLLPGDVLEFHARVRRYCKGSLIDYRLSYPTKIKLIPVDKKPARIETEIAETANTEQTPSLERSEPPRKLSALRRKENVLESARHTLQARNQNFKWWFTN
jgi:hypothetical protein